MIPEDIHTSRLRITVPLREYVKANIVAWYIFAKHTLGHEVQNGDLRVVYGCRKSSGFGIAAARRVAGQPNTRLTFSVDSPRAATSGCPYRWSHNGSAEVKAGPSQQEYSEISGGIPVNNQCLFVNTLDAKVSAELWQRIEGQGIVTTMDEDSEVTFQTTPPQDSSTQRLTGKSDTKETTNSPSARQYHKV